MFVAPASDLSASCFDQAISEQIWKMKYRYAVEDRAIDQSVEGTWLRVAEGLTRIESEFARPRWKRVFYDAMRDFKLLPAGRILAGCGTARDVTLMNTFVMRTIPDSVDGIMSTMKEAARTMQMGGGIGFDFSTIRPEGALVRGLDCPAAGPLPAMRIADAICKMLVLGTGRGAMMATLSADHPDIEAFVTAKAEKGAFRNFNLSVLVPDRFMAAVEADAQWDLIWQGQTLRSVGARELWHLIMHQTYRSAEPGVLFIDRINQENPLRYLEDVSATNSCAEQPLPPNGACPLASINLARLVRQPFTEAAMLDLDELGYLTETAVRFLDNVIEVSRYPIPEQRWEAMNKRRIGIGLTGLGNALIMMGVRYGSDQAVALLDRWMAQIQNTAYSASADLAAERGSFPLYNRDAHLEQPVIAALDKDVRRKVAVFGLRNGLLTTIAPTGTVSMFGGNVSSGIEPVFAAAYKRRVTQSDGSLGEEIVEDYAAWRFHQLFGRNAPLPEAYVTATELSPEAHIRMQAAAQKWVDSGISKTVNCPETIAFEDFENVYFSAYAAGCKGCTTFRPNDVTGSVLST